MVLAEEQTDQWNRIEDPEIDQHKYAQLIFNKSAKTIQWREDSFVLFCFLLSPKIGLEQLNIVGKKNEP